MIPNPNFEAESAADERLTLIADYAARLGFEVVDIAGFLHEVDQQSQHQLSILGDVKTIADEVLEGNAAVRHALESVSTITDRTKEKVEGSVTFVRESGKKSQTVASWVKELSKRMESVATTLEAVEANNTNIADIARQVNILAINAKIEAARAGDSGRGFGVVAEAINELSQKTAKAAESIEENITDLSGIVGRLRSEATGVSNDAAVVISGAEETDRALTEIAQGVDETYSATNIMTSEAGKVRGAIEKFQPAFEQIGSSARKTAHDIHDANLRVENLVDTTETIFQTSVDLGGATDDLEFIDKLTEQARLVSQLFSDGIRLGEISHSDLFNRNYAEIPGTNPQQYRARFTAFTDKTLTEIQDDMLTFSSKIVFCAAIDPNGYLPTHNSKFSQPQREDPIWNAANARNRRMFDDRVGLKAGRSTAPFLLQVYRRDMGAGNFTMMKDLSVPIVVDGEHWGGLRLGYAF